MPPKRPKLESLCLTPSEKAVSITDTLTLVVKGDGGAEVRVKASGIASASPATSEAADVKLDPCVEVDKIKFEDLQTRHVLGKGSQGKVKLVRHRPTGKTYALKYIHLDGDTDNMREALESELRQVRAVRHRNVVTSYEAYFREGRLYIVLEYMDAGSMADILKRRSNHFTEEMLAYVARELLYGVEHLHSLKMIHRDIKPVNVLANSYGEVKIADFGVAKKLSDGGEGTMSAQGSVIYMSPERINGELYSFSSDIWSVGLTIAECALGVYPFTSLKNNIFDLLQAIATRTASIDWKSTGREHSAQLIDFVNHCLLPAASRPSARELLQHPLIQVAEGVSASDAGRWFTTVS
ncbi:protein kinase, putative [Trypanosoma equiperdum]|uniref:mitogen-activated protein kinase kinase n=4 Tax=Trypanozoon TaxID=39700 RepID=Q57YJ6_TRYB2|nr:protein kinase, putative [Trypanosoma brucei gambiense DAL972]XP_847425.1 protein kinase, putative [Trypanosoma brucei brucei TREU927]AAX69304.1 protein kinase, putative [Trypanosoma brucei]RHW72738.1 protein kinase [Trypanosoma brucei equiperdum]SCU64568.1 protein kinase, putative [Trypanosoma equiperdum]AAZ13359.1 protein kinase, putative [Trypanosoma brucei brucei TREU927]CBH13657.1 protein kinase, putative [Trypanosoma brucei gambiense DAL972]|eukprot:XP_011775933.1 protein kinase, putative [Trypanosoma brucei gambiense DAL972]